jgi:nucleoside diphosphate kinase
VAYPETEEPPIHTEQAFLLIKPDGVRQGRTAEVERMAAAEGLTTGVRRTVTLTPADVRFLWAEYTDDGHVLARAFLDRYLTSGPSEAIVVHGPDAFEAARRIKRRIRGRHAVGVFANVIHAAESRAELARQTGHLFDGVTAAAPVRPRPAGIDFRAIFDVPKLVGDLWPVLQEDLLPPYPHRTGTPETDLLLLGGDRDHTLDSTVTAIWHALPGIAPAQAVHLALFADRTDGFPIAVGNRRAMARAERTLRKHGIRHCRRVSAGPVPPPAPRTPPMPSPAADPAAPAPAF